MWVDRELTIFVANSLRRLLIICCGLMTFGAVGQEMTQDCPRGYAVYFVNGVLTTTAQATSHLRRVREMVDPGYQMRYAGETLTVELNFNPSDGWLDFFDVFRQKLVEDPSLSWENFIGWMAGTWQNPNLVFARSYLMAYIMPGRLRTAAARANSTSYVDPTVIRHADAYRTKLASATRVLVVSHSQGNLYTNAAFARLQTMNLGDSVTNGFVSTGVASPAAYVAGNGGYVTASTDIVINALRAFSPTTLPATDFSLPTMPEEDPAGHAFSEIYLNPRYKLAARVKSNLLAGLGRLRDNPRLVAPNLFRYRLSYQPYAAFNIYVVGEKPGEVIYFGAQNWSGTPQPPVNMEGVIETCFRITRIVYQQASDFPPLIYDFDIR